MKQILFLFIVAVFTAPLIQGWSGGLRVRFGIGTNYFYSLPLSVTDAVADGWTELERADTQLESLVLYCYDNRIVCTLYDDTDYIAGIQVAFPEDEFTDAVMDWEVQGFTEWTPSDGNTTYWTIQQYFVSEEFLATNASERLAARDSSTLLQDSGIWVSGFNKELLKISNSYDNIKDSEFTEQACIPLMGRHYYYNMTADLTCSSDTLFPWFPLVHSGELVATGLIVYGQMAEDADRDWFERPSKSAVELIVPYGPDCLYDLADSPGIVTMHIYYIDSPWQLTCLFQ